jgi:hypothetical protein
MRFSADNNWSDSYDLEAKLQGELLGSEDNREEKRAPAFKGK